MTHKAVLLFHEKVGYDNAEGKGHHKHLGGRELPCEFTTLERLVERFVQEVAHFRREMT